jgi:putative heme transporter
VTARRWWILARYLAGLVLASIAFFVVFGRRDELQGAAVAFDHLRWGWVLVALTSEALCLLAFALLQRRLLDVGCCHTSVGFVTALTFGGYAIQNSLPGGPAWSAVWAYRRLRDVGVDEVLSAWTLVASSLLSQATLVALAGTGVLIGGAAAGGLDVGTAVLLAAGVVALILLLWRQRRRLAPVAVAIVRLCQRVSGRPSGDPRAIVEEIQRRVTAVRPSTLDWTWMTWLALANWLGDVACLVIAYVAVGTPVPWRGILLAYAAAQLAANLPITPGGLGVVEGSLTVALVAYGGAEASTVVAVLLYRSISYWLPLPAGWASAAWLSLRHRRIEEGQEAVA